MKTWQKVAIGFGVFVAFMGIVFGLVVFATSGASDTIDEFLAAVRKGDYAAAHALTAEQMQAATPLDALERFAKANGFDKVTESSWSSRSMTGDQATFEGMLTTGTGGKLPVKFELVRENDAWRILSVDVSSAGVEGGRAIDVSDTIRRQAVAHVRVHQPLLIRALRTRDFEYLGSFLVPELTAAELAQAFGREGLTDAELLALERARPDITAVEHRGGNLMWVEATSIAEGAGVNTRFTYRQDPDRTDHWRIQAISYEAGQLVAEEGG